MKRWFCMFAACMWMIPAAIAERTARTNDIYQETPYTLTIQGETYTGMAQVTRTFPEQMSRLIGKGRRETRRRSPKTCSRGWACPPSR